jgi:hypothetical protein
MSNKIVANDRYRFRTEVISNLVADVLSHPTWGIAVLRQPPAGQPSLTGLNLA